MLADELFCGVGWFETVYFVQKLKVGASYIFLRSAHCVPVKRLAIYYKILTGSFDGPMTLIVAIEYF